MARYEHVTRLLRLLRHLERSPDGVSRAYYPPGNKHDQRFRRDIEALEEIGFPIYEDGAGPGRRFKLLESYRKRPSVPIRPTEIFALRGARSALENADHAGIVEALDALIGKLDATLTPEMRQFAKQLDDVFVGDPFGKVAVDCAEQLEVLLEACKRRRCVAIRYRDNKDNITDRTISPYNLWPREGRLYIIARCHLRDARRTFLLHHIVSAELTEERFEIPDTFRFETYVQGAFGVWRDGKKRDIAIRFAPEAAMYVRHRRWHPTQTLKENNDSSLTLTFQAEGLSEIAAWILSFGPRAQALAPPELVDEVRSQLDQARGAYVSSGATDAS